MNETLIWRRLLLSAGDRGATLHPPFKEGEIVEAEIRLGFNLFPPLRQLLLTCGGLAFTYGTLLGRASDSQRLQLECVLSWYPVWREKSWQPVADDGCGNYFVVVARRRDPIFPIAFIDVSENPDELNYTVASNLTAFLRGYLEKSSPEDAWPFNREWVLQHDPGITNVDIAPLPWDLSA